jgi:hypothetical protein
MSERSNFFKTYWAYITSGFCLVAGTAVLLFASQPELGWALLGASGLPIVIPAAFRSKTGASLFLAAALTLPLVGCKAHMINVEAFGPGLEKVLDRHDDYVKADKSLSEVVRDIYLKTTELIRKVLEEARK